MAHEHHHHHEMEEDKAGGRLWISVFLNLGITIVELTGGILSNSLALISDMKAVVCPVYLLPFILFGMMSCSGGSLDDYNDESYRLTDQNGQEVRFPDDFRGAPVLMGFIYTHCPDICSFITANLYKTWQEMDHPEDIQFVLVTFDPGRDTPEVLKEYASSFSMDRPPFRFLTGSEAEIGALMERVGIRSQISHTHETEEGENLYFLSHTDKILLIDPKARLVMDYGGSMTPTNILVEDLKSL